MNQRVAALLEQAKRLPRDERAQLADAVYDLVSPTDPEWEAAWLKECEDRLSAMDRGEMPARDFDEVMADARAKLRNG